MSKRINELRVFFQENSLQQSLGLACWVVGTEVLVFLHFLLQREQLTLEFAAQTRQRVPDVVGQLLGTRHTQFRDKAVIQIFLLLFFFVLELIGGELTANLVQGLL